MCATGCLGQDRLCDTWRTRDAGCEVLLTSPGFLLVILNKLIFGRFFVLFKSWTFLTAVFFRKARFLQPLDQSRRCPSPLLPPCGCVGGLWPVLVAGLVRGGFAVALQLAGHLSWGLSSVRPSARGVAGCFSSATWAAVSSVLMCQRLPFS